MGRLGEEPLVQQEQGELQQKKWQQADDHAGERGEWQQRERRGRLLPPKQQPERGGESRGVDQQGKQQKDSRQQSADSYFFRTGADTAVARQNPARQLLQPPAPPVRPPPGALTLSSPLQCCDPSCCGAGTLLLSSYALAHAGAGVPAAARSPVASVAPQGDAAHSQATRKPPERPPHAGAPEEVVCDGSQRGAQGSRRQHSRVWSTGDGSCSHSSSESSIHSIPQLRSHNSNSNEHGSCSSRRGRDSWQHGSCMPSSSSSLSSSCSSHPGCPGSGGDLMRNKQEGGAPTFFPNALRTLRRRRVTSNAEGRGRVFQKIAIFPAAAAAATPTPAAKVCACTAPAANTSSYTFGFNTHLRPNSAAVQQRQEERAQQGEQIQQSQQQEAHLQYQEQYGQQHRGQGQQQQQQVRKQQQMRQEQEAQQLQQVQQRQSHGENRSRPEGQEQRQHEGQQQERQHPDVHYDETQPRSVLQGPAQHRHRRKRDRHFLRRLAAAAWARRGNVQPGSVPAVAPTTASEPGPLHAVRWQCRGASEEAAAAPPVGWTCPTVVCSSSPASAASVPPKSFAPPGATSTRDPAAGNQRATAGGATPSAAAHGADGPAAVSGAPRTCTKGRPRTQLCESAIGGTAGSHAVADGAHSAVANETSVAAGALSALHRAAADSRGSCAAAVSAASAGPGATAAAKTAAAEGSAEGCTATSTGSSVTAAAVFMKDAAAARASGGEPATAFAPAAATTATQNLQVAARCQHSQHTKDGDATNARDVGRSLEEDSEFTRRSEKRRKWKQRLVRDNGRRKRVRLPKSRRCNRSALLHAVLTASEVLLRRRRTRPQNTSSCGRPSSSCCSERCVSVCSRRCAASAVVTASAQANLQQCFVSREGATVAAARRGMKEQTGTENNRESRDGCCGTENRSNSVDCSCVSTCRRQSCCHNSTRSSGSSRNYWYTTRINALWRRHGNRTPGLCEGGEGDCHCQSKQNASDDPANSSTCTGRCSDVSVSDRSTTSGCDCSSSLLDGRTGFSSRRSSRWGSFCVEGQQPRGIEQKHSPAHVADTRAAQLARTECLPCDGATAASPCAAAFAAAGGTTADAVETSVTRRGSNRASRLRWLGRPAFLACPCGPVASSGDRHAGAAEGGRATLATIAAVTGREAAPAAHGSAVRIRPTTTHINSGASAGAKSFAAELRRAVLCRNGPAASHEVPCYPAAGAAAVNGTSRAPSCDPPAAAAAAASQTTARNPIPSPAAHDAATRHCCGAGETGFSTSQPAASHYDGKVTWGTAAASAVRVHGMTADIREYFPAAAATVRSAPAATGQASEDTRRVIVVGGPAATSCVGGCSDTPSDTGTPEAAPACSLFFSVVGSRSSASRPGDKTLIQSSSSSSSLLPCSAAWPSVSFSSSSFVGHCRKKFVLRRRQSSNGATYTRPAAHASWSAAASAVPLNRLQGESTGVLSASAALLVPARLLHVCETAIIHAHPSFERSLAGTPRVCGAAYPASTTAAAANSAGSVLSGLRVGIVAVAGNSDHPAIGTISAVAGAAADTLHGVGAAAASVAAGDVYFTVAAADVSNASIAGAGNSSLPPAERRKLVGGGTGGTPLDSIDSSRRCRERPLESEEPTDRNVCRAGARWQSAGRRAPLPSSGRCCGDVAADVDTCRRSDCCSFSYSDNMARVCAGDLRDDCCVSVEGARPVRLDRAQARGCCCYKATAGSPFDVRGVGCPCEQTALAAEPSVTALWTSSSTCFAVKADALGWPSRKGPALCFEKNKSAAGAACNGKERLHAVREAELEAACSGLKRRPRSLFRDQTCRGCARDTEGRLVPRRERTVTSGRSSGRGRPRCSSTSTARRFNGVCVRERESVRNCRSAGNSVVSSRSSSVCDSCSPFCETPRSERRILVPRRKGSKNRSSTSSRTSSSDRDLRSRGAVYRSLGTETSVFSRGEDSVSSVTSRVLGEWSSAWKPGENYSLLRKWCRRNYSLACLDTPRPPLRHITESCVGTAPPTERPRPPAAGTFSAAGGGAATVAAPSVMPLRAAEMRTFLPTSSTRSSVWPSLPTTSSQCRGEQQWQRPQQPEAEHEQQQCPWQRQQQLPWHRQPHQKLPWQQQQLSWHQQQREQPLEQQQQLQQQPGNHQQQGTRQNDQGLKQQQLKPQEGQVPATGKQRDAAAQQQQQMETQGCVPHDTLRPRPPRVTSLPGASCRRAAPVSRQPQPPVQPPQSDQQSERGLQVEPQQSEKKQLKEQQDAEEQQQSAHDEFRGKYTTRPSLSRSRSLLTLPRRLPTRSRRHDQEQQRLLESDRSDSNSSEGQHQVIRGDRIVSGEGRSLSLREWDLPSFRRQSDKPTRRLPCHQQQPVSHQPLPPPQPKRHNAHDRHTSGGGKWMRTRTSLRATAAGGGEDEASGQQKQICSSRSGRSEREGAAEADCIRPPGARTELTIDEASVAAAAVAAAAVEGRGADLIAEETETVLLPRSCFRGVCKWLQHRFYGRGELERLCSVFSPHRVEEAVLQSRALSLAEKQRLFLCVRSRARPAAAAAAAHCDNQGLFFSPPTARSSPGSCCVTHRTAPGSSLSKSNGCRSGSRRVWRSRHLRRNCSSSRRNSSSPSSSDSGSRSGDTSVRKYCNTSRMTWSSGSQWRHLDAHSEQRCSRGYTRSYEQRHVGSSRSDCSSGGDEDEEEVHVRRVQHRQHTDRVLFFRGQASQQEGDGAVCHRAAAIVRSGGRNRAAGASVRGTVDAVAGRQRGSSGNSSSSSVTCRGSGRSRSSSRRSSRSSVRSSVDSSVGGKELPHCPRRGGSSRSSSRELGRMWEEQQQEMDGGKKALLLVPLQKVSSSSRQRLRRVREGLQRIRGSRRGAPTPLTTADAPAVAELAADARDMTAAAAADARAPAAAEAAAAAPCAVTAGPPVGRGVEVVSEEREQQRRERSRRRSEGNTEKVDLQQAQQQPDTSHEEAEQQQRMWESALGDASQRAALEGCVEEVQRKKAVKNAESFRVGFLRNLAALRGISFAAHHLLQLQQQSVLSQAVQHQEKFSLLWGLLMPETRLPARVCKEWKELGFQGEDPSTDFRGCGVLALDTLVFLAVNFTSHARRMLHASHQQQCWYSFAITNINVTSWLIEWLVQRRPDVAAFFFRTHSATAVESTFYYLAAYLFTRFHNFWMCKRPASIMEFPFVAGEFKQGVQLPAAFPACCLLTKEGGCTVLPNRAAAAAAAIRRASAAGAAAGAAADAVSKNLAAAAAVARTPKATAVDAASPATVGAGGGAAGASPASPETAAVEGAVAVAAVMQATAAASCATGITAAPGQLRATSHDTRGGGGIPVREPSGTGEKEAATAMTRATGVRAATWRPTTGVATAKGGHLAAAAQTRRRKIRALALARSGFLHARYASLASAYMDSLLQVSLPCPAAAAIARQQARAAGAAAAAAASETLKQPREPPRRLGGASQLCTTSAWRALRSPSLRRLRVRSRGARGAAAAASAAAVRRVDSVAAAACECAGAEAAAPSDALFSHAAAAASHAADSSGVGSRSARAAPSGGRAHRSPRKRKSSNNCFEGATMRSGASNTHFHIQPISAAAGRGAGEEEAKATSECPCCCNWEPLEAIVLQPGQQRCGFFAATAAPLTTGLSREAPPTCLRSCYSRPQQQPRVYAASMPVALSLIENRRTGHPAARRAAAFGRGRSAAWTVNGDSPKRPARIRTCSSSSRNTRPIVCMRWGSTSRSNSRSDVRDALPGTRGRSRAPRVVAAGGGAATAAGKRSLLVGRGRSYCWSEWKAKRHSSRRRNAEPVRTTGVAQLGALEASRTAAVASKTVAARPTVPASTNRPGPVLQESEQQASDSNNSRECRRSGAAHATKQSESRRKRIYAYWRSRSGMRWRSTGGHRRRSEHQNTKQGDLCNAIRDDEGKQKSGAENELFCSSEKKSAWQLARKAFAARWVSISQRQRSGLGHSNSRCCSSSGGRRRSNSRPGSENPARGSSSVSRRGSTRSDKSRNGYSNRSSGSGGVESVCGSCSCVDAAETAERDSRWAEGTDSPRPSPRSRGCGPTISILHTRRSSSRRERSRSSSRSAGSRSKSCSDKEGSATNKRLFREEIRREGGQKGRKREWLPVERVSDERRAGSDFKKEGGSLESYDIANTEDVSTGALQRVPLLQQEQHQKKQMQRPQLLQEQHVPGRQHTQQLQRPQQQLQAQCLPRQQQQPQLLQQRHAETQPLSQKLRQFDEDSKVCLLNPWWPAATVSQWPSGNAASLSEMSGTAISTAADGGAPRTARGTSAVETAAAATFGETEAARAETAAQLQLPTWMKTGSTGSADCIRLPRSTPCSQLHALLLSNEQVQVHQRQQEQQPGQQQVLQPGQQLLQPGQQQLLQPGQQHLLQSAQQHLLQSGQQHLLQSGQQHQNPPQQHHVPQQAQEHQVLPQRQTAQQEHQTQNEQRQRRTGPLPTDWYYQGSRPPSAAYSVDGTARYFSACSREYPTVSASPLSTKAAATFHRPPTQPAAWIRSGPLRHGFAAAAAATATPARGAQTAAVAVATPQVTSSSSTTLLAFNGQLDSEGYTNPHAVPCCTRVASLPNIVFCTPVTAAAATANTCTGATSRPCATATTQQQQQNATPYRSRSSKMTVGNSGETSSMGSNRCTSTSHDSLSLTK